jgi:putative tricarboxylic transport membrane protein
MRLSRTTLLMHAAYVLAWTYSVNALCAGSAQTAWQPTKPVEYIVPSGAGAALDTAARVIKQVFESQKIVTQPIVVVNKAGGGGALMNAYLDQRVGDANVLATIAPTLLTSRITGQLKQTYSDFTPLAVLFDEFVAVAVRNDSPIKTAADLIDRLKKSDGHLSVGVAAAIGNHVHIGIVLPVKAAGVDLKKLHAVAYKSSAESVTGMLSGDLDLVASTTSNLVTLAAAGKLRIIAISSPSRLGGALAEVPTWREQGIDVQLVAAQGVMGPRGLSEDQIAYWVGALSRLQHSSDYLTLLERHYWTANFKGHQEAVKYYDAQYLAWKRSLTDLGMVKD